MESPTHYELLCVSPDATADEIRAAYRRIIRLYHPDVAGASGAAMTLRLNDAQRALLDDVSRAAYDRGGRHAAHSATPSSPPSPSQRQDARQPSTPHTAWRPTEDDRPRPQPARPPVSWNAAHYRAWGIATGASIIALSLATALVFAYSYAGELTLTSPRIIPALAIANAWIVLGSNKPWKLFIAFMTIAAGLWPMAAFGVPLISELGTVVPLPVLSLLTLAAVAVVCIRTAAPKFHALGRRRPVVRESPFRREQASAFR
jgi:DnaJ domain